MSVLGVWLALAVPAWASAPAPSTSGHARDTAAPASLAVYVLTMSPGAHPFERFGHAAIRVDGLGHEPLVFNYGTFDGHDPALVWHFLNQTMPFWLSVTSWHTTEQQYARRRITLQRLALDAAEAQQLAAALWNNAQPANRYYRYEFFRDNCSTRVRDQVAALFPAWRARFQAQPGHKTFRRHVRDILRPVPLLGRAIDLVLNQAVDQPTTRWEDAFLPRELAALLREGRKLDDRPLVLLEQEWIGPQAEATQPHMIDAALSAPATEWLLLGLLLGPLALAAAAGVLGRPVPRLSGAAIAAWGLATGLIGVGVLVFTLTPYDVAHGNGNGLVLSPLTWILTGYGARLLRGRLDPTGRRRLQVFLGLLLGVIVLDLGAHAIGRATQEHLPVLLVMGLGHLLALLALGRLGDGPDKLTSSSRTQG